MPKFLKVPLKVTNIIEGKKKWLEQLERAQVTLQDDQTILNAAKKGMLLKERHLPPEVLGRSYIRYCRLINEMYDTYLNNVHLQRAPYILDIITVILKRIFELRDELCHYIVNDYIYADAALRSFHMSPVDIQIVVPYHFPLAFRSENLEQVLQQMWVDALKRKKKRERPPRPPKPRKINPSSIALMDPDTEITDTEATAEIEEEDEDDETPPASVHTFYSEDYLNAVTIQRQERSRVFRLEATRAEDAHYKQYFSKSKEPLPMALQIKAATVIKVVCREFMRIKRKRYIDNNRDILLGMIPDPFTPKINFAVENNKTYEKRRNTRRELYESYIKDLEIEKARLIMIRKDNQMEDITDEIREWFKEWFYGYKFFPQYPYDVEGGTILVVRGDYQTIEEQFEEDERILNETKGKTKEQIKEEKAKAKEEEKLKEEARRIAEKKAHENMVKERCNPFSDPGYAIKQSTTTNDVAEAIRNYRTTWSLYDQTTPEEYKETVYGYLMPVLAEDLMKQIHLDCRQIVDSLMRIELKLLIEKYQFEYKQLGWKYPKFKPRKKPRPPPQIDPLVLDKDLLTSFEKIFDINIVTKPTTKFNDIYGDSSYAAYDYNIRDPYAKFPIPGYGDIKGRLMLSCIFGCGIQPGAPKLKAVMLVGPARNGKSFLVDAVAGELNAVKIDITPEVFSAVVKNPAKAMTDVLTIAKAFQPAVVFLKNIERVFIRKVTADQKRLKAKTLKNPLTNLVKRISNDDKIIFIATCSNPWAAKIKPMLKLFDEIILVPRSDYGSIQQFFFKKLNGIRSMPRDYPIQPIAQFFQGYGFSDIIAVYNEVMTSERIVRLHTKYLHPGEFIEVTVQKGLEPVTTEDYEKYATFYISNSPLKQDRIEYEKINFTRGELYAKMAKKEAEEAQKAAKE